jgi:hypothetical protein
MTSHPSHPPASGLRGRMIEAMTVRGFGAKTCHDCVRHVRTFAASKFPMEVTFNGVKQ